MPRYRRTRTIAVIAVIACAALTSPAVLPGSGAAAGKPTTLTIATNGSVDSLSPFLAQRALPTQIHRLSYDFLTNYDARDDHPVPGLATSWTTSPDKLVWTFTIRDGSTWSDGRPVTADDAAWTFRLMMTDPVAATANGNFVANVDSVTAPDAHTLVIRLKRPQATMLALDIPIVPRHVWESKVAGLATFNNDTEFPVVGDGPFILTGYAKDQYLELSANPRYWRGRPRFDKVVFRYYRDGDTAVEALKKGEAHFVSGLTPAQFDALRGKPNIARNSAQGKRFYALARNPGATTTSGQAFGDGNPALRDVRVRQALAYAIDTRTLVAKTLGGYGEVGAGYLPPIFAANHWSPDRSSAYTYDPAKANQLLDAAGYHRGPDGKRTTPTGAPFTLRLFGQAQRPDDAQNATYVTEWLAGVGITVTTSLLDQGKLADAETAGNYDLAFDSWITNPDPDYVLWIQTCGARPNTVGGTVSGDNFVCDPAYDALYERQLAEYDPTVRAGLVKQMQQRLYENAYLDILYYPNVLEAYRSDVIGSMQKQPQPGGVYYGQDGYWSWWSAAPPANRSAPPAAAPATVFAGAATVVAFAVLGAVVVARRRRLNVAERE